MTERHTFWVKGGRRGGDTGEQDGGMLDLTAFTLPRRLGSSCGFSSPCSFVRGVRRTTRRLLFFGPLCESVSPLVWSVTIYTFNKSPCGAVMGSWARRWNTEEMSAAEKSGEKTNRFLEIAASSALIETRVKKLCCRVFMHSPCLCACVRVSLCVSRLLNQFTVSLKKSKLLFLTLFFPAPAMDNKGSSFSFFVPCNLISGGEEEREQRGDEGGNLSYFLK